MLHNRHPLVTGYHVGDEWMERWFSPALWMWRYNMSYLVTLLTWSCP